MEHNSWLVPCHSEAGAKKRRKVTKKEALEEDSEIKIDRANSRAKAKSAGIAWASPQS